MFLEQENDNFFTSFFFNKEWVDYNLWTFMKLSNMV